MLRSRIGKIAAAGVVLAASLSLWPATAGAGPSGVKVTPGHISCPAQPVSAGPVSCGSSISITNNGSSPVTIFYSFDGAGGSFLFGPAQCVDTTVSPGGSCVAQVSFDPGFAGRNKLTLGVRDLATGNLLGKVGITGTGT